MRLQLSTWQEIEAYLQASKTVVVPIGSTEQHGPNGLIGTDAICPEIITTTLASHRHLLIAPTLALGMAQHHMAFAGSMTLRPSTLIAVIEDVVDSLVRHGFENILFLNGHGGNIATVNAAFSQIYGRSSLSQVENETTLNLKLVNWWEGKRVGQLSKQYFPGIEGSHATPSEISLTYFAYPDAVKIATMSPEIAPSGQFRDAQDFRRQFPDGRIGSNPAGASVEIGEALLQAAVSDLQESMEHFGFL